MAERMKDFFSASYGRMWKKKHRCCSVYILSVYMQYNTLSDSSIKYAYRRILAVLNGATSGVPSLQARLSVRDFALPTVRPDLAWSPKRV
jgi:hypothetical protein